MDNDPLSSIDPLGLKKICLGVKEWTYGDPKAVKAEVFHSGIVICGDDGKITDEIHYGPERGNNSPLVKEGPAKDPSEFWKLIEIKCDAGEVDKKIQQLKDAARKFNDQLALNPKNYDVRGCGDSYNCHKAVKELLNQCGLQPPDRSQLPKPSKPPTVLGTPIPDIFVDPYTGLF